MKLTLTQNYASWSPRSPPEVLSDNMEDIISVMIVALIHASFSTHQWWIFTCYFIVKPLPVTKSFCNSAQPAFTFTATEANCRSLRWLINLWELQTLPLNSTKDRANEGAKQKQQLRERNSHVPLAASLVSAPFPTGRFFFFSATATKWQKPGNESVGKCTGTVTLPNAAC